jgi:hypothetical protein
MTKPNENGAKVWKIALIENVTFSFIFERGEDDAAMSESD